MSEAISAQEAKERARNRSRIIAEEELQSIYQLIEEACARGEYEVYYKGNLTQHSFNRLKELGYKAEEMKSREETIYISWNG